MENEGVQDGGITQDSQAAASENIAGIDQLNQYLGTSDQDASGPKEPVADAKPEAGESGESVVEGGEPAEKAKPATIFTDSQIQDAATTLIRNGWGYDQVQSMIKNSPDMLVTQAMSTKPQSPAAGQAQAGPDTSKMSDEQKFTLERVKKMFEEHGLGDQMSEFTKEFSRAISAELETVRQQAQDFEAQLEEQKAHAFRQKNQASFPSLQNDGIYKQVLQRYRQFRKMDNTPGKEEQAFQAAALYEIGSNESFSAALNLIKDNHESRKSGQPTVKSAGTTDKRSMTNDERDEYLAMEYFNKVNG